MSGHSSWRAAPATSSSSASGSATGGSIGYFPGDRTPIHNATALAAAFLARLHALTGRPDFSVASRAAIGFVADHQRADGAWAYALGDHGGWVDGLHTGYVLDAVRLCAELFSDDALADSHARGLAYYRDNLFLEDGTPKFYDGRVHPIDAQSAAQAIRTFAGAGDAGSLEQAWRVYDYAVANLDGADGTFAFQRHRGWVDRTPHVRWVQAPMLDAMSRLLGAANATAHK